MGYQEDLASELSARKVQRETASDAEIKRDKDGKFGSGGGSGGKMSKSDRGGNLKDRSDEVLHSQVNSMQRLAGQKEFPKNAKRADLEAAYRKHSK